MKHVSILSIIAALIGMANPAYAVSVRNLSGSTQVLIVEQGGVTRTVTLAPGERFRYYGADVTLSVPGQNPKQTDYYEDYSIWPDGKLNIQRIKNSHGHSR